jgi:carbonic anhydrase
VILAVPPEFVFDVTLGDIFVVRTAGEVVDAVALGSIEYAIEGDPIDNAVRANARDIAKRLQSTGSIIPQRMQAGEVKIGAYYSPDTG